MQTRYSRPLPPSTPAVPIPSVEPQRLYRQIADQLAQRIRAGSFGIGDRLPAERDLARQMGVSRPSVREALIALEVEGLVEVRTGSGVYVQARQARSPAVGTARDEWGPLELIRARQVVEGEVAAMAARQARRKDVSAMKQALQRMRDDAAAGVMPLQGDRDFHAAIAAACGNAVLAETVQSFWDSRRGPVFARLGGHFETAASWRKAVDEHEAVLAAIQAHEPEDARRCMQEHLDRAHARFSVSWRKVRSRS